MMRRGATRDETGGRPEGSARICSTALSCAASAKFCSDGLAFRFTRSPDLRPGVLPPWAGGGPGRCRLTRGMGSWMAPWEAR